MDPFTSVVMIKALDGLTARSVVTAQNIANAGTPGYRPMRVSFEQALASAASAGAGAVRAVMPHIEVDPTAAGDSELRTDLELATASTTTARYAALVEVLNRRLQIDALALSGAR